MLVFPHLGGEKSPQANKSRPERWALNGRLCTSRVERECGSGEEDSRNPTGEVYTMMTMELDLTSLHLAGPIFVTTGVGLRVDYWRWCSGFRNVRHGRRGTASVLRR